MPTEDKSSVDRRFVGLSFGALAGAAILFAVGWLSTVSMVAAVADSVGLEEVMVFGPDDVVGTQLKLAAAFAFPVLVGWVLCLVSRLRRGDGPGLRLSALLFGAPLLGAGLGMLVWTFRIQAAWAATSDELGIEPMAAFSSLSPAGWGFRGALLVGVVLVFVAARRPPSD